MQYFFIVQSIPNCFIFNFCREIAYFKTPKTFFASPEKLTKGTTIHKALVFSRNFKDILLIYISPYHPRHKRHLILHKTSTFSAPRMINTNTPVLEQPSRISPSLSPLRSMATSQNLVTSPQNLVTSSQLFVTSSQNQLTSQPLIVSSSSPFIAGPLNGNSHLMRGFQTPFMGSPTFLPNHRPSSSPVISSPKSGRQILEFL